MKCSSSFFFFRFVFFKILFKRVFVTSKSGSGVLTLLGWGKKTIYFYNRFWKGFSYSFSINVFQNCIWVRKVLDKFLLVLVKAWARQLGPKRVVSSRFLRSFVQRLLVFSLCGQLFLKPKLKLAHNSGSTGVEVKACFWLISSELADYLN